MRYIKLMLQRHQQGFKRKRRKQRYMKGFSHWCGQHQSTKRQAKRQSRRDAKKSIRTTLFSTTRGI